MNGNEPLHRRRKSMASPLSQNLRERYGRRSFPVRKGDKVTIMRGDFTGVKGEVIGVDTKNQRITVEGVEITKADESEVPIPVHPSNVKITGLKRDKKRVKGGKVAERQLPKA